MRRGFPVLKLTGLVLFVLGSIILAFSIIGLAPGDQPSEVGTMVTLLMFDLLMLFVATFMVSAGMFFFIYGGDGKSGEPRRRNW
ncbi:MAG: hypothetical protein ISF22_01485 [Methanomassiliicoccus sp.]|nr:hypothetical protein [Methanomassiliicoccus sp.]